MKQRLIAAITAWSRQNDEGDVRVRWTGEAGGAAAAEALLGRSLGDSARAVYRSLPPFDLEIRDGDERWSPVLHWYSAERMSGEKGFDYEEYFDADAFMEVYLRGHPRVSPREALDMLRRLEEDEAYELELGDRNPFRVFAGGAFSGDDWMLCFHDGGEPEVWGMQRKGYLNLGIPLGEFVERVLDDPRWLLENRPLVLPLLEASAERVAALEERLEAIEE